MSITAFTPYDIRLKNLVRIAALAGGLALPSAVFFIYLAIKTLNIYNFFIAGAFVLISIISTLIFLSRNLEKPSIGAWHLIFSNVLVSWLLSAIYSNAGAEIGSVTLIVTLAIAIQTLPPKHIVRGTAMGAIASLGASLLVFYSPIPQTSNQTTDLIVTWLARGTTLAILAFLFTQFRNLILSSKLLVSFLSLVILISMTFNIVIGATTSRVLTEQVGKEIQTVAEARGTLIGDYLLGQVEVLQTFSSNINIRQAVRSSNALNTELEIINKIDEDWRQSIENGTENPVVNFYQSNSLANDLRAFQNVSKGHLEMLVTDKSGVLVGATHVTPTYYQAYEDWWLEATKGGAGDVYISQPQYNENAQTLAIYIAVPIYDPELNEFIGVLRSTLLLDKIIEILEIPIGESGELNILFPGEPPLMLHQNMTTEEADPIILEHILQIEETDKFFITTMYKGENSIFTFAPIRTITGTSEINLLDWNTIIHQQEAEMLAPVRDQIRLTSFLGTLMAGLAALFSLVISQRLAQPIINLKEVAERVSAGDLNSRALVESQDEIGQLAETFNMMTSRLQETLGGLEERVAERTAELEESAQQLKKRADQFEAVSVLTHAITSSQEMKILLPKITELVSQYFDFYHTGLFLLDGSRKFAVLSAASSEGGKRMLARKHRLPVGEVGIVGYVTATGNPRIALDTEADSDYFDNPDMPETRSEMALPLRAGGIIIGALDVQSTEPNAFSEDDVEVLTILADAVSVAIESARLYEETQRLLKDAQGVSSEFTQEAWQNFAKSRKLIGYEISGASINALDKPVKNNGSTKSIPIKLRNQVIGHININLPENQSWDPNDLEITEALAERVGVAIESATLLEDSQRRATRESMIGDISAKLNASTEIEQLMQVAVGELREALGASEVTLKINPEN